MSSTPNLQPIENTPRKPPVRCFITPEERRSIVAMVCIHMRSIRSKARHHGLPEMEVETIVLEELGKQKRKAFQDGYRMGRLSWLPPGQAMRAA